MWWYHLLVNLKRAQEKLFTWKWSNIEFFPLANIYSNEIKSNFFTVKLKRAKFDWIKSLQIIVRHFCKVSRMLF